MLVRRSAWLAVLVGVLLPLAATAAAGAPPAPAAHAGAGEREAQSLLAQATRLYADGAFVKASALLERAARLARGRALRGKVYLYRGLIDAAAGRTERARRHFTRALTNDPSLDLDPSQYKPSLVQLFRSTRRRWQGTLDVPAPAGRSDLEVWIGAQRVAHTPARLRLPPGPHTVEIRDHHGHTLHRSTITIVSGRSSRLLVALAAPPPTTMPGATTQPSPRPPHTRPRQRGRLWTWIAAGLSAAAIAVAIGTGVAARSDDDDACALLAGSGPCDQRRQLVDATERSSYDALHGAAVREGLASNIAWASAAGLAAAAVVLFFVEGRRGERTPPPSRAVVAPGVGSALAGLSLELRY